MKIFDGKLYRKDGKTLISTVLRSIKIDLVEGKMYCLQPNGEVEYSLLSDYNMIEFGTLREVVNPIEYEYNLN